MTNYKDWKHDFPKDKEESNEKDPLQSMACCKTHLNWYSLKKVKGSTSSDIAQKPDFVTSKMPIG